MSEPTAAIGYGTLTVATPAVSGQAKVGQTLTVEAGDWTLGTVFDYQWLADGTPLVGATESTLDLNADHLGKAITIQVTGSRAGYVTASSASAATAPVAEGSLDAVVPTVTGPATVGKTLSADAGTWSPSSVTLRYQWYRSGVAIDGAAEAALQLTADDAGATITVQVTGSEPGYTSETRTSEPTANVSYEAVPAGVAFSDQNGTSNDTYTVPATNGVDYQINGEIVAAGTYPGTGIVTVTATAKAGYVLAPNVAVSWSVTFKSTPYSVSPSAVVFSDLLGTKDDTYTIPNTTGADYLVGGKAVAAGTYLGTGTVTVTAMAKTDYDIQSGAASSWTFTFKGDLIGAAPKITGTSKVGYALTAVPGIWSPSPVTLSYQWYRSGVAVAGATAATYSLPASAAGATYTVRVAASKAGYASVVKASAASAVVATGSLVGATPRITGTAKVGYALTATAGVWSPAPVVLKYQWYRAGVAIAGATAASYRLPASAAGATYTVRVTGAKTGYSSLVKASAATSVVAKGSLVAAVPRITGTAKVGYALTAIPGAWSPAPVVLRYQWYRSGVAIVGATAASYRLPASAAGARFSIRVTGSKPGYSTLAKTSAVTAAVAKGSLAGTAPRITGTAKVGYVLTAIAGAWSPAPVALRYQWYRSGVAVVGATAASYRLPASAAGATYAARVTGSKTGYTALVKASGATARIAAPYIPPSPAVYYANCTAVRNAGKAPLFRGQPGYRDALDRDNDGIACE
ncbi:excalibur calcium-binding domain-containing protein [Arthrobacter sp. NPDC056691]|uniref:excalibur calcium-binding domain-containing protein n=1 Tax=Arthrobacter sp. NPDC056691 TaxID=3345913 RepID=UPI00366F9625